ncbi:MAG: WD40 repeat domain-containing serine/threonine-protein kinase [Myxococcota bacterium]
MTSSPLAVSAPDFLTFVGLERSHLRSAVYRRVFGDEQGPIRIGRYSILERVGSGARGVVFKAFDNQLDRLVALKVLSTRADDHDELVREAKALARLSHPNVLPVYEVGATEDGQVFLATEYVKGWTLRGWFEEEHRSEAAVVDVLRQVALGVQAAHDEGLVHRDLKPSNILLGRDGRVRVADFGLARFDPSAVEPTEACGALQTTTAGTPGYMAPELFAGASATPASDQYAIAITGHELLRGGLPGQEPTPRRRVSAGVDAVLQRALKDEPKERFETVGALAAALTRGQRPQWRRASTWAFAGLAAAGAGALTMAAQDPDPSIALLQAEAALPDDPARALTALRALENYGTRARALIERAVALGPASLELRLPPGITYPRVCGGLLFYGVEGHWHAHDLSESGTSEVPLAQLGIREEPLPENAMTLGPRWRDLSIDDPRLLAEYDALCAADMQYRSDVAASRDALVVARIEEGQHAIRVEVRGGDEWRHETDATIHRVRVHPDGSQVAWIENRGAAFVHDLRIGITQALGPAAADVEFDPSHGHVFIRGYSTGLFRQNLDNDYVLRLSAEDIEYSSLRVAPDGRWIAAQTGDGDTFLSRIDGRMATPRTVEGTLVGFSPDGVHAVTKTGNTLLVHHLLSLSQTPLTAPSSIQSADFDTDGAVWAVSADRVLRRFELPRVHALDGHDAPVFALALSQDGTTAVSSAEDYTVRVWDVDEGTSRTLTELDWAPRQLFLDEANDRVVASHWGNATPLIGLASGAIESEAPPADLITMGPDGTLFGMREGVLWSWKDGVTKTVTEDAPRVLDGMTGCGALTAGEGFVAAACGREAELHVWSLDGTHQRLPIGGEVGFSGLHVWPDETHLLFVGDEPVAFERDGAGAFEAVPAKSRLDVGGRPYFRGATSDAGDLLYMGKEGVHALWRGERQAVHTVQTERSRVFALSGDGRRYAYANSGWYGISVRERPVSNGAHDVSAMLQDLAVQEGSL